MNKFYLLSEGYELHKLFYFKNSCRPWDKYMNICCMNTASNRNWQNLLSGLHLNKCQTQTLLFLFKNNQYVEKCRQNLFF